MVLSGCGNFINLQLSIFGIGTDYDSLCEFNRELRFIAENDIFEELRLHVVVRAFNSLLTEWCVSDFASNGRDIVVFNSMEGSG